MNYRVRDGAGEVRLEVGPVRDGSAGWTHFDWAVDGGPAQPARARREGDELVIEVGGARHRMFVGRPRGGAGAVEVAHGPETFAMRVLRGAGAGARGTGGAAGGPQAVHTPMPGRVQAVHVKSGDTVARGQLLVTFEAMKMQNEFLSPADGQVTEVRVTPGMVAAAGDVLLVVRPGGNG